ncbi:MAG: 3-carboxymuconate cyclase [Bryobacterales bacterium]|nr:3-carboxymuconate cyclase [Bryobacterales bacterium]
MIKFQQILFCAVLSLSFAHAQTSRAVLYSSLGAELTQYDVDAGSAALVKKGLVRLPANVQYAWQHPSRKYFYVAWSDGGAAAAAPGAATVPKGSLHGVTAFAIDPQSGALRQIGQPASLPARPIHLSVDMSGAHVLVAYNIPSSITVHRLNADGTLGAQVSQPSPLDTGIYAHQIRVEPSGKDVIMVTRGNVATKTKAEDRGGVKLYSYAGGVLKNRASIAPNGGVNFQPRHLDFDPSQRWIYLSLEAQSKLQVYPLGKDGGLAANPAFTKDSLANPAQKSLRQNAGTLHVHPSGRFVYQANRSAVADASGRHVLGGGENTIAVYAINQQTGEPALIQNVDTRGAEPRTFALDPSARMLVVGNQTAVFDGSGPNAKSIPSSLAVFRAGTDGKLEYVRKYDVSSGKESLFWMGIVPLP